jgi:hypothetical protein
MIVDELMRCVSMTVMCAEIYFVEPTVLQKNLALQILALQNCYKIVSHFELGPTKFVGPNQQAHFDPTKL